MNAKRKRPKASAARPAPPAPVAPCAPRGRAYPLLRELLAEPALASALRGATLGGAALAALALGGCEPPACQPTRLGELGAHGGEALSLLTRLAPRDGANELGVGLGLLPHPASYMMAGEIAPVRPTPLPSAPPPPSPPAGGPRLPGGPR